jgi:hypothetical protein
VGNGSDAIRGLRYQFLYMLLTMLEESDDASGYAPRSLDHRA